VNINFSRRTLLHDVSGWTQNFKAGAAPAASQLQKYEIAVDLISVLLGQ
jgi:hypothetical protein